MITSSVFTNLYVYIVVNCSSSIVIDGVKRATISCFWLALRNAVHRIRPNSKHLVTLDNLVKYQKACTGRLDSMIEFKEDSNSDPANPRLLVPVCLQNLLDKLAVNLNIYMVVPVVNNNNGTTELSCFLAFSFKCMDHGKSAKDVDLLLKDSHYYDIICKHENQEIVKKTESFALDEDDFIKQKSTRTIDFARVLLTGEDMWLLDYLEDTLSPEEEVLVGEICVFATKAFTIGDLFHFCETWKVSPSRLRQFVLEISNRRRMQREVLTSQHVQKYGPRTYASCRGVA